MGKWELVQVSLIIFFLFLVYFRALMNLRLKEREADRILEEAEEQKEAKKREAILEAREEIQRLRTEAEREIRERRADLQRSERRISQREENIERRQAALERRERQTQQKEQEANRLHEEASRLVEAQRQELERVAQLPAEEARQIILRRVEEECQLDAARLVKAIEAEAIEEAEQRARKVITLAIQKCAVDQTAETTVSVVTLPNDDMKGRIIGREGRNIRAFETLTGVDLIIDDTPEAVVISAFDVVRREIARIALENLVLDGRIHPARIEEMVQKARAQVEQEIKMAGERAILDTGLSGVDPELIKILGRLRYRTSYGQNVLKHSMEVAYLAAAMASELGLDPLLAKRAGLFHDLGKAVDFETDGPHATIGADLARKHGEPREVVQAIAAHHADVDQDSAYAVLVQAADAISAARPGARREGLETYVKRLETLEQLGDSFDGVEKTFAVQAGREIRVMVKPDRVTDEGAAKLARDIVKRIESELEYPGQIKVTVIRETRMVEYAK
ncbi:MAG TPA: ribonuclease Y [Armatimonadota bacterium]|nr:ribonuclease Y [Armatimonadota bacterium]HOJ20556.1 ribonuclease Y [Armatimonadota bacterium]HOM80166.1 ribonuclease Y [Armatimonadota bacterium]HOQ27672.1 ribonuclease Y [Armatimonadota bacterium]HPO71590.1 ribonuclease Y [Armatimonadota bacterium]